MGFRSSEGAGPRFRELCFDLTKPKTQTASSDTGPVLEEPFRCDKRQEEADPIIDFRPNRWNGNLFTTLVLSAGFSPIRETFMTKQYSRAISCSGKPNLGDPFSRSCPESGPIPFHAAISKASFRCTSESFVSDNADLRLFAVPY